MREPAVDRTLLADRVRAAIARSGLTSGELARQTRLEPDLIRRYRDGKAIPKVSDLARIAYVLGLGVEQFVAPGDAVSAATAGPERAVVGCALCDAVLIEEHRPDETLTETTERCRSRALGSGALRELPARLGRGTSRFVCGSCVREATAHVRPVTSTHVPHAPAALP
jgi:transcriptional regulator with XRE-family HTH domain